MFLILEQPQDFIEINAGEYLKFSCFGLKSIKTSAFSTLKLKKLLFFSPFFLDVVFEPLYNLLLGGNLLLSSLNFLFKDLFTFFWFCKLLPQSCIGGELLLQIINLKLMPFPLKNIF